MKYFSILEQPTKEAIRAFAEKRNLSEHLPETYKHPQEDYLIAFVAHFDKDMNAKFMSTGLCSPYAVINGEERVTGHLEKGVFDLENGDRIFVFTDGFEHYVKNNDFLEIFKNWENNLEKRIREFSKSMNLKDPENYGHERSLIAILI
jgi:serine/threonine protein phosphatase PrpC